MSIHSIPPANRPDDDSADDVTDPAATPAPVGSVLTCRNAGLAEIVDILRAQQEVKLDLVAPAAELRAHHGRLQVAGAAHTLTVDGVSRADAVLAPTAAADGDLAAKLDIPLPYLRRMRARRPDLYDANINGWLAERPDRRFLVRALHDDTTDGSGVLRAVLSDSYRIVDNLDVLLTALSGIRAAGAAVDITQADLSETRMYVIICTSQAPS